MIVAHRVGGEGCSSQHFVIYVISQLAGSDELYVLHD
jgi:hypothetical protein